DHGGDQRLLAGEVLVERSDAHPGNFRDAIGAGLVETFLHQNASGRLDQAVHGRARSLLSGEFPGLDEGFARHFLVRPMRVEKANDRSYSEGTRTPHPQETDDMDDTLHHLFGYKAWANDQLLTALARLGDDSPITALAIKALSHTHVVD